VLAGRPWPRRERQRRLRLIAVRPLLCEFRTLHRAPVRTGKLVERIEYLSGNGHQDAFDRGGLRRELPNARVRRCLSNQERDQSRDYRDVDQNFLHCRFTIQAR